MDAGFHLTGSAELLPPAVLHALVCAHARAGRGCTPGAICWFRGFQIQS